MGYNEMNKGSENIGWCSEEWDFKLVMWANIDMRRNDWKIDENVGEISGYGKLLECRRIYGD